MGRKKEDVKGVDGTKVPDPWEGFKASRCKCPGPADYCIGKDCNIYDREDDCCSVLSIALALKTLASSK